MAPPYILHVLSQPHIVPSSTWTEWYTSEHLPDMVDSKVSSTAVLYHAIENHPLSTPPPPGKNAMPFLAVYQSDSARPPYREAYSNGLIRRTSALFPADTDCYGVGSFEATNYELIQAYDPKHVGEGPASFLMHAEIEPLSSDGLDQWYRLEHLPDMSHRHAGYRRTLRYRAGVTEEGSSEPAASFLTMHEFDVLPMAGGAGVEVTEWTKQVIGTAKVFNVRIFELVASKGFDKDRQ